MPLFTAFNSASLRSRRALASAGSFPTDSRTRFALFAPFQVIRAFGVPLFLAIHYHNVGLDTSMAGRGNTATLAAFGLFLVRLTSRLPSVILPDSVSV
jgi:hypothetical protein